MIAPPPKDGRHAQRPYRVRAGTVWYWVDPTVSAAAIEPGDTVVLYPVGGHAVVAILQADHRGSGLMFMSINDGDRFEVDKRDIEAMHLAAVDDVQ